MSAAKAFRLNSDSSFCCADRARLRSGWLCSVGGATSLLQVTMRGPRFLNDTKTSQVTLLCWNVKWTTMVTCHLFDSRRTTDPSRSLNVDPAPQLLKLLPVNPSPQSLNAFVWGEDDDLRQTGIERFELRSLPPCERERFVAMPLGSVRSEPCYQ